ncbi:hypothetical protein GS506_19010 [Rhodococcus hoagii]|nr:hypothetical protein [Prescottella equi]
MDSLLVTVWLLVPYYRHGDDDGALCAVTAVPPRLPAARTRRTSRPRAVTGPPVRF